MIEIQYCYFSVPVYI